MSGPDQYGHLVFAYDGGEGADLEVIVVRRPKNVGPSSFKVRWQDGDHTEHVCEFTTDDLKRIEGFVSGGVRVKEWKPVVR